MMIMTTKIDMKKILIALAAIAGVIIALVALLGGGNDTTPTAASAVTGNDARVKFLTDMGWEVNTSPAESSQVRIPETQSEVFQKYNDLQKSQGYDLSQYAGKTVMRYVYKVKNFTGATEPVYATLLVYKNQIIGGDITDTAANGKIQGFQKQDSSNQAVPPETTSATTPTNAT